MDNLVSVPVTHPCRFLKQQASLAQPTIPPVRTQTIKSPEDSTPAIPKRRPTPKKKLVQEWLEF